MRNLALVSLIVVGFIGDAFCAAAPARRTRTTPNASAAATSAKGTTAARAAVGTRTAPRATGGTAAVSARAAVSPRAATTTAAKPTVSARAATTQKVVGTGTKVATAAKNIVVSEECQAKYEGCMDAFCMLDNDTGGRCLCSDKNAEYDAILAEIEKLDQQSYQMATFGVEKLEMGADADEAIKMADKVAQEMIEGGTASTKARRALDLTMWNTAVDFDSEGDGVFSESMSSAIDGKEGDALHRVAADICVAQMPECESEINMLQMMYGQRIKSDCTAYENSLKQKRTESAQKLQAAERALREVALEQYQNANKYDLGQCTVEFKKCMQTTGGCGNDFSGCASMIAMDATNTRKSNSKDVEMYSIKGAVTTIDISMSTYDALMSKKPLCETVTKQCVRVADQVWDTFLREVAPQIKSAELIAEDKARQDCIGNISSCFQKACKDTMDPNDPDGSYDMCLSRPAAMLNVCKIPLNACGIDASSATEAAKSDIWDFVTARLAAMRVGACTTEVKECLQSEDVCGEDYLNCIGLDTYTIMNMCHRDKLTACYSSEYGDNDQEREEYIYSVAQGLILSIDNEMLAECQKAVDEAMIKVCGDTESCKNMTIADGVGANALEYKVCEYAELGSVFVKDEKSEDIVLPGFDSGYLFSNCKQDISLILDEELLGTVEYNTATRPENHLDTSAIDDIDRAIVSRLENMDGDNGTVAVGLLERLRSKKKLSNIVQSDIRFQYKTYSGVKRFMGVIDGVVAWNKIDLLMGDLCPVDNPANTDTNISESANTVEIKGIGNSKLCMYGINNALQSGNLGQNGIAKQQQILSDLGALRNSVNNTIYAIESDPTVQFCMTGRAVQGLKMGLDGKSERSVARFPNLTDEVRTIIAQEALKKAQDNYNKRYDELSERMAKDNVALAERMAKVREERERADRAELAARACLNLGANAALPVTTDTDLSDLQSGRGYTATSQNDDPYYRETVTTTFSPETFICKKCVRTQNCTKRKGYKDCCYIDSRYCKAWADPVEKCEETQF
ncbi:MAG: hypothetical protein E7006_04285 [Alphaproteobacteria bacterium]|nr:hypothetical protein [Alphaproteobacteria bacterium]